MRFDGDTITITNPGTRIQVLNTKEKVLTMTFHARLGNAGNVNAVTSSGDKDNGREIGPDGTVTFNFGGGSVRAESFYVDGTTAQDKIDWTAILN